MINVSGGLLSLIVLSIWIFCIKYISWFIFIILHIVIFYGVPYYALFSGFITRCCWSGIYTAWAILTLWWSFYYIMLYQIVRSRTLQFSKHCDWAIKSWSHCAKNLHSICLHNLLQLTVFIMFHQHISYGVFYVHLILNYEIFHTYMFVCISFSG